jgi:hypothetical protein
MIEISTLELICIIAVSGIIRFAAGIFICRFYYKPRLINLTARLQTARKENEEVKSALTDGFTAIVNSLPNH